MKRLRSRKLVPYWKQLLFHTWEIRFYILAGLCDLAEIVLAYYPDKLPRGAMVGVSGVFALLGLYARFFIKKDKENE